MRRLVATYVSVVLLTVVTALFVSGCGCVISGIEKAKCETCDGSGVCPLCGGDGDGIFWGDCMACERRGICGDCTGTGINLSD